MGSNRTRRPTRTAGSSLEWRRTQLSDTPNREAVAHTSSRPCEVIGGGCFTDSTIRRPSRAGPRNRGNLRKPEILRGPLASKQFVPKAILLAEASPRRGDSLDRQKVARALICSIRLCPSNRCCVKWPVSNLPSSRFRDGEGIQAAV